MNDIASRIDPLFAQFDRPGSPGCALGIVWDGKLAFTRGYGQADLEHSVANGASAAYNIGSESKQFTGACIALLVEAGLLRLADPVNRFMPAVPFDGSRITIDHLVHHTSGIPDYWDRLEAAGRLDELSDRNTILRYALSYERADFAPGQACRYSNTGYLLLAAIIENVTSMRFGSFLNQAVLMPLGMTNTAVYDDPQMAIPHRARAYVKSPDGRFELKTWPNYTGYGDGNIYSTVEDLVRWDQNFRENRLGNGRFLELMHTRGRLQNGTACKYAFGLDMGQFGPDNWRGEAISAHGGGCAGFESILLRIPSRQFTVILLCNTRDRSLKPKAMDIADTLLIRA